MSSKPRFDSPAKAPQAIVDLCAGLLPVWTRHLAASRAQSETAVHSMLQAFASIGPQLQQLQRQAAAADHENTPVSQPGPAGDISQHIDAMYAGFQYQDRISQMMALLESDMQRMQQVLDGESTDVPQIQEWLAQLESRYAMAEQRISHHGADGADSAGGKETDFF
jgi:hypothetical protein